VVSGREGAHTLHAGDRFVGQDRLPGSIDDLPARR
jgi:hypothetical protein